MPNTSAPKTKSVRSAVYQIVIEGHLGLQWTDWFEGLTITLTEGGETLLTGPVTDQAALHGLFKKVRDLGMSLVSVHRLEPGPAQRYGSLAAREDCSKMEQKVITTKPTTGMETRVRLSMLWIFVLLNMAYADIVSLMDPISPIRKVMEGATLPPGGLLAGAILMETAIAMVLLSWVLKRGANRWVNISVSALNIVAVVTGGQGLYYAFFATIEVLCMLLIIWSAWKWSGPESYRLPDD